MLPPFAFPHSIAGTTGGSPCGRSAPVGLRLIGDYLYHGSQRGQRCRSILSPSGCRLFVQIDAAGTTGVKKA